MRRRREPFAEHNRAKETTMRTLKTLAVVSFIAALSVGAVAQGAVKADPVLKQIPAGTMGFAVVNNLKDALGNVDKFITDIGLRDQEEIKAKLSKPLLALLKEALEAGEGFTGDGGVAITMLDLAAFDISVDKLIAGGPGAMEDIKLPYVVFIPGSSLKAVLPKVETEAAGDYTKVKMPFGPMVSAQSGGYVLLSPSEKALEKVLKSPKKVADELSDAHMKILVQSDIAVHVNMKACAPVVKSLLKMVEGQMGRGSPLPASAMGKLMDVYADMLVQIQRITVGLRIAKTGVVLDELVDYVPDSMMGKSIASYKAPTGSLLGRLPNLPYVLAIGAGGSGKTTEEEVSMGMKVLDVFLELLGGKLDETIKGKIKKLMTDAGEQVTEMQIVGGGGVEGAGVLGLACVVKCKDAAKFKTLLSSGAALTQEIILAVAGDDPDTKGLNIAYSQNVESIGDVKLDAIEVTFPALAKMPEKDRGQMAKIIGEDRIRFLVASPDATTVVMTFGGGKAFMEQALKTVKDGGNIAKAEGVEEALRNLPQQPMMVLLFSVGNLFDVIAKGSQAVGEHPPNFKIATRTPVAFGATASGSSIQVGVYVPTDLIKEVVKMITTRPEGRMAPPRPPLAPGNF
jgi:hypothetical protein